MSNLLVKFRKSNFSSKIKILGKNRNFFQKSKFWSKTLSHKLLACVVIMLNATIMLPLCLIMLIATICGKYREYTVLRKYNFFYIFLPENNKKNDLISLSFFDSIFKIPSIKNRKFCVKNCNFDQIWYNILNSVYSKEIAFVTIFENNFDLINFSTFCKL